MADKTFLIGDVKLTFSPKPDLDCFWLRIEQANNDVTVPMTKDQLSTLGDILKLLSR